MTKKQTTDKINQPEFAPEEWRKAAIMYDTSFAWCKNQISAWGKNQISFTPGFNEMFDEALDTLPERNRDIVQKYFRDRMTFSQIADLHGTSRSIVRHLCLDGMEGHEFDSAARRKQPKCRATNRRRN